MPSGRYQRPSALERFEASYIPEPNSGCWLWIGNQIDRKGYGRFTIDGRNGPAHRAAWRLYRGPIQSREIHVCHRCDTRACVNPDHLFLGTAADNNEDMRRKGRLVFPGAKERATRTHCKNGHEFTPENTRMRPYPQRGRECRACRRQFGLRHRGKRRALVSVRGESSNG